MLVSRANSINTARLEFTLEITCVRMRAKWVSTTRKGDINTSAVPTLEASPNNSIHVPKRMEWELKFLLSRKIMNICATYALIIRRHPFLCLFTLVLSFRDWSLFRLHTFRLSQVFPCLIWCLSLLELFHCPKCLLSLMHPPGVFFKRLMGPLPVHFANYKWQSLCNSLKYHTGWNVLLYFGLSVVVFLYIKAASLYKKLMFCSIEWSFFYCGWIPKDEQGNSQNYTYINSPFPRAHFDCNFLKKPAGGRAKSVQKKLADLL